VLPEGIRTTVIAAMCQVILKISQGFQAWQAKSKLGRLEGQKEI